MIFTKVDFSAESEVPTLSPQEEAKLQKRLKEIDDAEQYALIALESGWYPCNHPGRPAFFLHEGEVWKYGTTTKGQFARYSIKYLAGINVSYFIQFRGTISECLKQEQLKLFYYTYLPENLIRTPQDRLPRPPYSNKFGVFLNDLYICSKIYAMKVLKVVEEDIANKIDTAYILEQFRHIDNVIITFMCTRDERELRIGSMKMAILS